MRRRGLAAGLAGALAALLLLFVLTDLPGRTGAPSGDRVAVMVVDHGYHAGLVLPRALLAERAAALGLPQLRDMASRFVAYDWLEVGWGDEGFYRHAPEIGALTLPRALKALFGTDNPSVLHVVGFSGPPAAYFHLSDMVRLDVARADFDHIARNIAATLAPQAQGASEPLSSGLYGASLFFRADGAYHLARNCNHWVARVLNGAGVPVSLAAATVSSGLLADLRWRGGATAP